MSTRANIIIKDRYNSLYFYRHCDGYPSGTLPTLEKFLSLIREKKIRDNVSQASGWLIIIGAAEYQTIQNNIFTQNNRDNLYKKLNPNDWKVGAYEPTTDIHGDIEYLYIVDIDKLIIKTITKNFDDWRRTK